MLPKIKKPKQVVYLDNAAATPLDTRSFKVMQELYRKQYGNPSSLYSLGQESKKLLKGLRSDTARILNCKPEEILFTAGGTESINLAVLGVARRYIKLARVNPQHPAPHVNT